MRGIVQRFRLLLVHNSRFSISRAAGFTCGATGAAREQPPRVHALQRLGGQEGFMRKQCAPGDLAVIVREEPGLEANIGRFVWVDAGPFEDDEYGPVFTIKPAGAEAMHSLCRDGSIDYDSSTPTYHPDAWMEPVWRPSPKRRSQLRAPLRNLPKLSREWLEAVMRGEA